MTDCKNCNYTDEYCASGECTSQRPRNDLATTSQVSDLTEQWKKDKLKGGYYYIRLNGEDGVHIDFYNSETGDWDKYYPSNIIHIYSRVPSLDELQSMNGNMDSVMQTNQALCKKLSELKEVLKECQNMIAFKHEVYEEDALIKKIDEVLNA